MCVWQLQSVRFHWTLWMLQASITGSPVKCNCLALWVGWKTYISHILEWCANITNKKILAVKGINNLQQKMLAHVHNVMFVNPWSETWFLIFFHSIRSMEIKTLTEHFKIETYKICIVFLFICFGNPAFYSRQEHSFLTA